MNYRSYLQDMVKIKPFFWAFVIAVVLTFFSMGIVGMALYETVAFVLEPMGYRLSNVHGDSVWPLLIMTGLCWTVSILFAGVVDYKLRTRGYARPLRLLAMACIFWLWALIVWAVALS